MTRGTATEQQIHIAIADWVRWNEKKYPPLRLMFHSPNGGLRSKREASTFQKMLVRAGIPDLCMPWSNGKFKGLAIEVKTLKGVLSNHQKNYIRILREAGWFVEVCRSPDEAIRTMERYFEVQR